MLQDVGMENSLKVDSPDPTSQNALISLYFFGKDDKDMMLTFGFPEKSAILSLRRTLLTLTTLTC